MPSAMPMDILRVFSSGQRPAAAAAVQPQQKADAASQQAQSDQTGQWEVKTTYDLPGFFLFADPAPAF